MTGRAVRRYEMLVRVSEFGAEHAPSFPPGTVGGRAFAAVREMVAALRRHAVAQTPAQSREHFGQKTKARGRLLESLRVIRRTSRGIAEDIPALRRAFQVPKSSGDRALLTAARAFVHKARDLEGAFI